MQMQMQMPNSISTTHQLRHPLSIKIVGLHPAIFITLHGQGHPGFCRCNGPSAGRDRLASPTMLFIFFKCVCVFGHFCRIANHPPQQATSKDLQAPVNRIRVRSGGVPFCHAWRRMGWHGRNEKGGAEKSPSIAYLNTSPRDFSSASKCKWAVNQSIPVLFPSPAPDAHPSSAVGPCLSNELSSPQSAAEALHSR